MCLRNFGYIALFVLLCLVNSDAVAQTKQDTNELEELKRQLEIIKEDYSAKLAELEGLINQIKDKIEKKEQEEELRKLLEEANQLKTVEKKEDEGIGKKFRSGVRQQSGLNPNISLSGDFFGGFSSEDVQLIKEANDYSYGNNGFHLRELELNITAPLDPFTRGKTFISVSESEIAIEEAYMEWLNLPANMNLKIGLFNPEFGILNRYHDHALPQFDRPKVLTNMFTNANMGGFGAAGNFLLKPFFGSDASILDLTVVNGGTGQSFTDQGDLNLLYVANMTNFYDITDDTFFEFRVGGVTGYNDPAEQYRTVIGNLAFNIKWIPSGRAKYRTIDWKTEFLFSKRETPGDPLNTWGFYSSLQNKMNAQWWLTSRFDYSELPYDKDQHEWAATVGLDFWQSDFVFIRYQYQYTKREFTNLRTIPGLYPSDSQFIIQVNWAMGPHKHEAY